MNQFTPLAQQIAEEAGVPQNVGMIARQLERNALAKSFVANRAAIDAANDEHAGRVLARVKANAAKLMADLPSRTDEEPNHGPLWDDHDVAAVRAASWDGSL